MALGRRKRERQTELWVASGDLPRSGGHPFYQKLNGLLDEAGFDDFVEELCRPFYADDLKKKRGQVHLTSCPRVDVTFNLPAKKRT